MALKSEKLFDALVPLLKGKSGEDLVKKVKAVFHFELSKAKGETPVIFTLDLKNGEGSFAKGKNGTPDATFAMLDDDLVAMAQGKLNPQQAFMQGKMKIKGNMAAAMRFTPDLLPKTPSL